MFELALTKLLVALGYSADEVRECLRGEDAVKVFEPLRKSVWGWSVVVIGAPILSPFIARGVSWLSRVFDKRKEVS